MTKYQEQKNKVREAAIEWQTVATIQPLSYSDLVEIAEHFRPLAKRYGLLREFKENGIL